MMNDYRYSIHIKVICPNKHFFFFFWGGGGRPHINPLSGQNEIMTFSF